MPFTLEELALPLQEAFPTKEIAAAGGCRMVVCDAQRRSGFEPRATEGIDVSLVP